MTLRKNVKRWVYGSRGAFKYFGTKIYFPADSFAFHLACELGIYEIENVHLLQEMILPDSVYFDVGANIGLMAAPVLAQRADCRVVSFEPSPTIVPFLRRSVNESRFGERWQLVEKAVGAQEGSASFQIGSEAGAVYDGLRDTSRNGKTVSKQVEVTTLDAEWTRMNKPQVSMIKIDVEGGEIDVLRGARECLQAGRATVLAEWNRTNFSAYQRKPTDLLDFAYDIGYRVFATSNFACIENLATLELHMLHSEYFLLRPN